MEKADTTPSGVGSFPDSLLPSKKDSAMKSAFTALSICVACTTREKRKNNHDHSFDVAASEGLKVGGYPGHKEN